MLVTGGWWRADGPRDTLEKCSRRARNIRFPHDRREHSFSTHYEHGQISTDQEIRDQCPCANVFRICIQECSLIGRHSGMVVGGILVNIGGYRYIAGARG